MADDTQVSDNPIIAADDIGGVKYQRTKVVWGSDGTANDADASNPLPTGLYVGGTQITFPVPIVASSGTITGTTSAYSTGHAYNSTQVTFSQVVSENGGSGHILGATCSDTNAVAKQLRAHFFNKSVASQSSNVAINVSDTDVLQWFGSVDFTDWKTLTSSAACQGTLARPIPFKCDAATDDIYMHIEVLESATYTTTTPLKFNLIIQPDA